MDHNLVSMDVSEQEHTCEEVNGIRAAMDQRVTSMAEGVTLDYRDGGVMMEGLTENNC